MTRKAKTILVAGYYGFNNAGDEAILATIIQGIKEQLEEVRFYVVSGNPLETEKSHGVHAISWSDLQGIVKVMGQSDLVILGGGGLFHDYWGFDPTSVLTQNHSGIGFYSSISLLALILNKPLILYAIGVGPLFDGTSKRYIQATVEQAAIITVRDTHSKELLHMLGALPEHISVTADPAFCLQPKNMQEEVSNIVGQNGPVMGVAVRNWDVNIQPDYWEVQVAEAMDSFLDHHNGSVIFIPFQDQGEILLDDLGVSKRIQRSLKNADRTYILEKSYSPAEKAGVIACCDLVLGMRLHAIIFAITSAVPVVGLIYDPKVKAQMVQAKIEGYGIDLGELTGQSLIRLLEEAYQNREQLKIHLRAVSDELVDKARSNAEFVATFLSGEPDTARSISPSAFQLLKDVALSLSQKVIVDLQQIQSLEVELNKQIEAKKRKVRSFKAEIQVLKNERDRVVTELIEQINQHDCTILELQHKLETQGRKHDQAMADFHEEMGKQIGYRDRIIEELNSKMEERAQVIADLKKELEHKESEQSQLVESFESQNAEKDKVIETLNSKITEKEKELLFLNSQLADIKSSRGWKLLWAMWQVRLFFIPKGSWREYLLGKVWNGLVKRPGIFIRKVARRAIALCNPCMSRYAFAFDMYKRQRNGSDSTDLSSIQTPGRQGLVSIVLPVYNGADLLPEAIDSVLDQSYENFELIAVDDGSIDNTDEILEEYARRDARIKVVHQENQKLPRALNRGFAWASGEFLTWTSHDNRLKPAFLEKMVACLRRHPAWDMVYANMDIIGEDGASLQASSWFGGYQRPPGSEHIYLPGDTAELNTYPNNFIGGAFLYRQRVPFLIGDYSPHCYTREDYDYWMRVNAFMTLKHTDFKEPVYDYRFHSKSLTSKDDELGITRFRNKLMVFDDFRRDFFLTSLVWFIDEDLSEGYTKNIANKFYSAIDCKGHILAANQQFELSLWPRLWVPSVYLKITDDPKSAVPLPDKFPSNALKVLLCPSAENLPTTLCGEWDFCLAYGSSASPPRLEGGMAGWLTSTDVNSLLSAIDIRARASHVALIEGEIYQPRQNKYKISVIICTYQGGQKLLDTLRTVANQTFRPEYYEVIVVNNEPDDSELPRLVAQVRSKEFSGRPDNLRLLLCPTLGLSHARNVGISEAQGEILIFLDDDSLASEDLLESYWQAFSENPDAGVIGGHIFVYPPCQMQIPWKDGYERYWSQFVTDYQDYTVVTNWWEYPWGANWSARREALLLIGGFRSRYGRRGRDFSGGEELVAASLIGKLGYSIAILPRAEVIHKVDEHRFTLTHLKNTIKAGVFTQYQAQNELHLPFEESVGRSFKQIVKNILKLILVFSSSNRTKKADLIEAYFYSLTRMQLLWLQISDGFRRMRRPVTRKK